MLIWKSTCLLSSSFVSCIAKMFMFRFIFNLKHQLAEQSLLSIGYWGEYCERKWHGPFWIVLSFRRLWVPVSKIKEVDKIRYRSYILDKLLLHSYTFVTGALFKDVMMKKSFKACKISLNQVSHEKGIYESKSLEKTVLQIDFDWVSDLLTQIVLNSEVLKQRWCQQDIIWIVKFCNTVP